MKIKFDVTPKELLILQDILEKYLKPNCKVWVFGSRAKSTSLFNSDLDLALDCKDKIALKILTKVKIAFEDARLPYSVDVVDINAVKPYFKEIIDKEKIVFPLKFLNKVPVLRFEEFSGEWEEKRLNNYCNKLASGKSKKNDNGKYNLYGSTSIIGKTNEYSHDGKFILIARVGANAGLTNTVNDKFGVTDNTLVVDLNEEADIHFILSLLNKYNLNKLIFGSGQPLITGGQLKSLKLNLPQKPEQKKIATFLTSIDTKIEQLTKKEKLLSTYKKGVMQKIFNQDIRLEDDGEWEEKEYGDIYSFYTTNSLSRDKLNYDNGTVKNIHYGDIHTKFNTMFNIQNEYVPFVNSDIDLSKIKKESYCLEGDLVIADASEDYMDIGKTMEIINLNNEKVIAGLHTLLARPNKYNIALGYMVYLLQSWEVRKQVMTIAQGTKVLSLSTKRLSKIKLNLPPLKEQTKIANFLSSIDKKIELATQQLDEVKAFKKALLQQMFV